MILESLLGTRRNTSILMLKFMSSWLGYGTQVHKNVQLRFIDSCKFMASILDKLASNLDYDRCKHLKEFYKKEEVFRIMRRKGIYPYEYMESWNKF